MSLVRTGANNERTTRHHGTNCRSRVDLGRATCGLPSGTRLYGAVALVQMVRVKHISYLGSELGYGVEGRGHKDLQLYVDTVEDYGLTCRVTLYQYCTWQKPSSALRIWSPPTSFTPSCRQAAFRSGAPASSSCCACACPGNTSSCSESRESGTSAYPSASRAAGYTAFAHSDS